MRIKKGIVLLGVFAFGLGTAPCWAQVSQLTMESALVSNEAQVNALNASTSSSASFTSALSAQTGIPTARLQNVMDASGTSSGELAVAAELAAQSHSDVSDVLGMRQSSGRSWSMIASTLGTSIGSAQQHLQGLLAKFQNGGGNINAAANAAGTLTAGMGNHDSSADSPSTPSDAQPSGATILASAQGTLSAAMSHPSNQQAPSTNSGSSDSKAPAPSNDSAPSGNSMTASASSQLQGTLNATFGHASAPSDNSAPSDHNSAPTQNSGSAPSAQSMTASASGQLQGTLAAAWSHSGSQNGSSAPSDNKVSNAPSGSMVASTTAQARSALSATLPSGKSNAQAPTMPGLPVTLAATSSSDGNGRSLTVNGDGAMTVAQGPAQPAGNGDSTTKGSNGPANTVSMFGSTRIMGSIIGVRSVSLTGNGSLGGALNAASVGPVTGIAGINATAGVSAGVGL